MAKLEYTGAVIICLLICFPFQGAFGCLYTVRDVGFADIGSDPYRLYFYVRDDTPEDLTFLLEQISYAALVDSNVEAEVVNVDQLKAHSEPAAGVAGFSLRNSPEMKYLDFWALRSFPAAILVSPEGQSLVLPISTPNKPFKETLWSALEGVVASPKRAEILSSIISSYCVILVIQGEDAAENEKAGRAVSEAVEEMGEVMSQMPKPAEKPPHVITIRPDLLSRERVLLWSLGINEEEIDLPCVAVLYGRGRRTGPILCGESITLSGMFSILMVIGSSCECGIDRELVLGTTIPLRWGEKPQSEAAKTLGFDVENPVVRTEMSQILSAGSVSKTNEGSADQVSTLEEYSEEPVELESRAATATVSPAQIRYLVSAKSGDSGSRMVLQKTLFVIIGMVLLILSCGVFIILRARRRI